MTITSSSIHKQLMLAIPQQQLIVSPQTSVMAAIAMMGEMGANCVIVSDPKGYELMGIFTERDLVSICIQSVPLAQLTMQTVMSHPVITIQETVLHNINDVLMLFQQHQIRHLPVLNGDRFMGVLTKDVLTEILAQTVLNSSDSEQKIIQECDRRYLNLAAAAPVAIFRFDKMFNCIYVNDLWSEMTGRSPESALENGWMDALHPDDDDHLISQLTQDYNQTNLNSPVIINSEVRYLLPDDRINWVYVQVVQEIDDENQITGYIGTLMDITARKQAELSLQKSEQRYRVLMDTASDAILLANIQGNLIEVNQKAADLLGYSRDELKSLHMSQIHPPEALEAARNHFMNVKQNKFAPAMESLVMRKDGSQIPVEITGSRIDLDGITIAQGIFRDIRDRKQLELELAESEAKFRRLVEGANDLIWSSDTNGTFTYLSPQFKVMFGWEPSAWVGKSYVDLVHPDDITHVKEFDKLIPVEFRHQCQDGRYIWVRVNTTPIFNFEGVLIGSQGVLTDISDLKQTELDLQQELLRRDAIFNASSDGIHILDIEGNLLEFNHRFAQMLGYTSAEIVGFNTAEWDAQWTPEELREVLRINFYTDNIFETLHRRKDGSIFPVEISRRPMKWQGKLTLVCISRDISDRKRLQQEQNRLISILEASTDYISMSDAHGTIFWKNAELKRLYGIDPDHDIRQFKISECHPHWAAEIVLQEGIPYAIATGSWVGETALFNAEGEEIPVSQLILSHRSPQGEIEFLSFIMRDMRVRKEYEQQLEQTNAELLRATRLKDEFLATMSHELRTPLNAILGMTEGLQEEIFGTLNERQINALQTIERSSYHLLELINDILDVAKIEAGQFELNYGSTAIAQLCQSSMTFIKQQALKKHIQIEIQIAPNLPDISLDERRIRQVLINLLNNAVKFTLQGGQIRLEVDKQEEQSSPNNIPWLRFSIIDTGIGIAPENIQKLFQPFIQIDSALNRKYEGTGLGLALVKQIVDLHGGKVSLTSELGVGSCFVVDIPYKNTFLTPSESQTQINLNFETDKPSQRRSPLILIAEDNETNINTIDDYLVTKGYCLLIARDGVEAIALAKSHQPDIILMDIQMPVMDGLEAIKQIRLDIMSTFADSFTTNELRSAIIRNPLVVNAETSVMDAIAQMIDIRNLGGVEESSSSCVLVVDGEKILGILTEHDVMHLSTKPRSLEALTMQEVMTSPVIALREADFQDLSSVISLFQQHHIRYLPIVDDGDRLLGIVTRESLWELIVAQCCELNLKKSEQRFPSLTTVAQVGIYRTDELGNCIYVNELWCQIAGLTPAAAAGFGWIYGIHPRDRDLVMEEWNASVQANRPFKLEYRFQNAEGQITWALGQAIAERNESGEIIGYVGTITDISDRMQAEKMLQQLNQDLERKVQERTAALQASEATNRATLEAIPDLLMRLKRDGTCMTYIKPGIDSENFLTILNHISEVLPSELLQNQLQIIEKAIATHKLQVYEHHFLKQGCTVYEEVRILAINEDEVLAIIRDVSDRKQAELRVEMQNSILERIVKGEPLADILEALVLAIEAQIEGAICSILLCDREGKLHLGAAPNLPDAYNQAIEGIAIGEGAGSCGTAAFRKKPVVVADIATDPLWRDYKELALGHNLRSCWSYPAISSFGIVLATFAVYHHDIHHPRQQELEVFALAANVVKIAVEREQATQALEQLNRELEDRVQRRTEALQQSESRLREAQQIAHLGSWELDVLTQKITWSEEIFNIFGLDPNCPEPTYEEFLQYFASHEQECLRLLNEQAIQQREPYAIIGQIIRPDGSNGYIFIKAEVIWDAVVQATRLFGIAMDISDRYTMQQALRRSEERARATLLALPDLVFRVNREGKYLDFAASPEGANLVDPHRVIGKYIYETLPSDITHAEKKYAALQQTLATQTVQSYEQQVLIDGNIHYEEVRVAPCGNDEVVFFIRDISDRKQSEIKLQQQTDRERLLMSITQRMRSSLNLAQILNATVKEVRQFLESDRVLIYQVFPGGMGAAIAESVLPNWLKVLDIVFPKEVFPEENYDRYVKGRIYTLSDREDPQQFVLPCLIDFLAQIQVRAKVVVPIVYQESLWGLLIAHQCDRPRQWQEWEIELLKQIANQLAIAIQQSNLYHQLQAKLAERQEAEIIIRRQIERELILREITQRIRQSLDIQTIFDTACQEIRQLVDVDRVGIFRFYPESNFDGEFVAESLVEEFPSLMKIRVHYHCFGEQYANHYQQGRIQVLDDIKKAGLQDCHLNVLLQFQIQANLVVPLLNGKELWGLLCLHQCATTRHWQEYEIDLLQQIANQLAIAIQQASLYEQIQVELLERQQAEFRLTESNQQLAVSNQELARATRLKDEFLANMSHELRTPLNAILGMTEGLQEGVFGTINDKQRKSLQTIERSGSHLLELINDILDVAKIESGQIKLELVSTSIPHLCQSSIAFVKQVAVQKNIQIHSKFQVNLPEILVDERRIRQVLINLLNNAVKFTSAGGSITLEVRRCQPITSLSQENSKEGKLIPMQYIQIAVIDTGIGIASENIPKLFKPFIQIDGALNRQYAGTGLGLALVKQIVELHGGRVELTSELGKGSCFFVKLPYILNPSSEISPNELLVTTSEPDLPNQSALLSPLILIAEDNEANIMTISSYLSAKGYRILLAGNGQEAIAMAISAQPDLILMDMQMPVMDGLEATKQIRQIPSLVNIPIIALTALAMKPDRDRCIAAGANEYLSKPVKLKQLSTIIQQLVVQQYR